MRRMGWIGGAVLALIALACVGSLPLTLARVAPDGDGGLAWGPRRFEAQDLDRALQPPSCVHPFGTDRLGRDLLARCLAGGAVSLGVGLVAAAIAVMIGTLYGAAAGSAGGRTDALMMRAVDVLYGLPSILLVVLLAVAADGLIEQSPDRGSIERHRGAVNIVTLFVAIGGVSWLTMARVIRGQVLSLRERPFMEAATAIGASPARRFAVHLLPNLVGPIVVYATLTVPAAILSESFLSFLGIGIREPLPSWGNLAADGLGELNTVRIRWWLLVWPCLLIAITLVALNFLGEALRESLDPRRRAPPIH
jgi:ABC-type dipeptide/oligopeptide/nickel transport system permease subunit